MSALTDLREYAMATREIRAIEQQIAKLLPTGAPAGVRAIGNSRGTNDPTAAAIQSVEGIEKVLKKKIADLKEKEIRGEKALDLIGDQKTRYVMRCYYMLGMSDAKIADEMFRSRSDVQRIRSAAEAYLDGIGGD